MVGVVVFSLVMDRRSSAPIAPSISLVLSAIGYGVIFLLGVYGGLFSGGYVTLLTAALIGCFGHTWLSAIATSKFINLFSSLTATLLFSTMGLVDYRLSLLLGAAMFGGGFLGSRVILKLSAQWLRRIYLLAVISLAIKLLVG